MVAAVDGPVVAAGWQIEDRTLERMGSRVADVNRTHDLRASERRGERVLCKNSAERSTAAPAASGRSVSPVTPGMGAHTQNSSKHSRWHDPWSGPAHLTGPIGTRSSFRTGRGPLGVVADHEYSRITTTALANPVDDVYDRSMQSWLPVTGPPAPVRGPKLSEHEWVSMGEGEPGELVAGFLEEEEVPDWVHELVVTWFISVFRSWLGTAGFVAGSDLKLLLGAETGRKADVVVILPGSPAPPRHGAMTTPPDILVEVVTPTPRDERRDRVEKMAEYAAFGVPRYLLADPALGSIEVFELDEKGRYARVAAGTQGQLAVPGCDGLVLDIDALWADIARLGDAET